MNLLGRCPPFSYFIEDQLTTSSQANIWKILTYLNYLYR